MTRFRGTWAEFRRTAVIVACAQTLAACSGSTTSYPMGEPFTHQALPAAIPSSPVMLVTLPSVNQLAVVDPTTLSIAGLIDVPGNPRALVSNPTRPEAYVAVDGGSVISIVDYRTPRVRGSIAVPSGVARFVVSGTGDRLYAVNTVGTVSVISIVQQRVLSTVNLGVSTVGIAFSTANHRIFVSMPESNRIAVINSDTDRREPDIFMGRCGRAKCKAYDLVSSYDGSYILAACNAGIVSAVEAQTDTIVSKFGVGLHTGAFLGINPLTSFAAMVDQEFNQYLFLVPTTPPFKGGSEIRRFHPPSHVVDVAFSPDSGAPYGAQVGGSETSGKIVIEPKEHGDKVLLLGSSPGGLVFAH